MDKWLARRKGLYQHRSTQHINTKKNIHAPIGRLEAPSRRTWNEYIADIDWLLQRDTFQTPFTTTYIVLATHNYLLHKNM